MWRASVAETGWAGTVLLTDGEERSVLASARTLARAGYRVVVGASTEPAAAHWSRSVHARCWLPDARWSTSAFARAVSVVAAGGPAVLLPGSEAALVALSEHRDMLPASC